MEIFLSVKSAWSLFEISVHIPYCGSAIQGAVALLRTHGSIAGCQALRKQTGHVLFGMRVVFGEPVFLTLSPNRRHSSLILKLSPPGETMLGSQVMMTFHGRRRNFAGLTNLQYSFQVSVPPARMWSLYLPHWISRV